MSVKEMEFFMKFFPAFRKLEKERQNAIGLATEGARIAAELIAADEGSFATQNRA